MAKRQLWIGVWAVALLAAAPGWTQDNQPTKEE